jgi:hemerythrin-like metal-binding protein
MGRDRITWGPELMIDEGFINHEHQQLIAAVNDLARRIDAPPADAGSGAGITEMLSFLAIYAHLHFQEEESWMARAGYIDLERHRGLHAGFQARIEAFRIAHARGDDVLQAMLDFLQGWLVSHIMGADRAFAPALKAYQQRQ